MQPQEGPTCKGPGEVDRLALKSGRVPAAPGREMGCQQASSVQTRSGRGLTARQRKPKKRRAACKANAIGVARHGELWTFSGVLLPDTRLARVAKHAGDAEELTRWSLRPAGLQPAHGKCA